MGIFSAFKDRKNGKKREETPTIQSHYIKLSRKAAVIRYTVMLLVVAFAVYSFAFYPDDITMENFRYMLKFINLGDDADAPAGNLIAFDGNEGNRGLIYKGDLAILNEGGLTITGWDGDILHKSNFSYDHPKMAEDGNFLYCYDLGGKDLRIFNSYQQIEKVPTFDYPINGLAVSKSKRFAVISSEKGYRSALYVYDEHFRVLCSVKLGSKYISSCALSEDGNEFLISAYNSENGNLVTQISRYKINNDEKNLELVFSIDYVGEIPLGVYYTDNGYSLMTSDNLRIFDNDNKITAQMDFTSRELLSGKIEGDRALMTYGLNGLSGGTEAIVYKLDGSVEYSKEFPTSLSDTAIGGDTLYTLSPGTLTVCNISTGEKKNYSVPSSYSTLVPDGEKIILFSENQAEYFIPENFDTKQ